MNNSQTSALNHLEILEESAWGDIVPFTDYPNNDWQDIAAGQYYGNAFTTINDRKDGKNFPIYQNEQDLARIRAQVRRFIGLCEISEAVTSVLQSYTLGSRGIQYKVQAKRGKDVPRGIIESATRVLDRFAEHNVLQNSFDKEFIRRSIDDGEPLVGLEVSTAKSEQIDALFFEGDQLVQPRNYRSADFGNWINDQFGIDCDSFSPCWMFGVLTREFRTHQPLAYHVIKDSAGFDYEVYPEERFVHFKRNVTRNMKRGISDWYCVKDRLAQSWKLERNMAYAAALQAAIAYIQTFPPGTQPGQLPGSSILDGIYPKPTNIGQGGGTRQQKQLTFGPGTVLKVTQGMAYTEAPGGTNRYQGFEIVAKRITQLTGCRFVIPYYMISGDAADNNFASGLIAEAPFVKAREADQANYGAAFVQMLWKVLRLAWRNEWFDLQGMPWNQLKDVVEITLDMPRVATRDMTALVNQLVQEVTVLGTKSRETACVELGGDWQEELAKGAKPDSTSIVQPGNTKDGEQMPGQAQDGVEQNQQPTQEQPAELATASARQFDRTHRAIQKVLGQLQAGTISRTHAKAMLGAVGMQDQRADSLLDDAMNGGEPQKLAAVESVLIEADVSTEARDKSGKWTSGAGSHVTVNPRATEFAKDSAEPGTFYSGSHQGFDTFNDHSYLTPDKDIAGEYGKHVVAAKVNVKNVFYPRSIAEIARESGIEPDENSSFVFEELDRQKVRDALAKAGYDAVSFKDVAPNSDGSRTHDAMIVFNGKNIMKQNDVVKDGKFGIRKRKVRESVLTEAAHDVSGESRDSGGKFSAGGSSGAKKSTCQLTGCEFEGKGKNHPKLRDVLDDAMKSGTRQKVIDAIKDAKDEGTSSIDEFHHVAIHAHEAAKQGQAFDRKARVEAQDEWKRKRRESESLNAKLRSAGFRWKKGDEDHPDNEFQPMGESGYSLHDEHGNRVSLEDAKKHLGIHESVLIEGGPGSGVKAVAPIEEEFASSAPGVSWEDYP